MSKITRRNILKTGAAAAAMPWLLDAASAFAASSPFRPESGAELNILRWRRFVPEEQAAWDAMAEAFSRATGVRVTTDSLNFADTRAKARVAASVGTGPDMVMLIHGDAHTYPEALLDVTDLAGYVGEQGGGWLPLAEEYGKRGDNWISVPTFVNPNGVMHYRKSWSQQAGFGSFPKDTAGYLEYARAMKGVGHPVGVTLGNAAGDGTSWAYWLLWAFGGRIANANNEVTLGSSETLAALRYAKDLAANFVSGTESWDDGANNRAYLGENIGATPNAISIMRAARVDFPEIAADTGLAALPTGPSGRLLEFNPAYPIITYKHTAYPDACKAFIAWMTQPDNYNELIMGAKGFFAPLLKAGLGNGVWEAEGLPNLEDKGMTTLSYAADGLLNAPAAQVFGDLVVVQMVAKAASGQMTPEEAMAEAEARAKRFYVL